LNFYSAEGKGGGEKSKHYRAITIFFRMGERGKGRGEKRESAGHIFFM